MIPVGITPPPDPSVVYLYYLPSCNKVKCGEKGLHVCRMLLQHVARDDSGLSLARSKYTTFS